MIKFKSFDRESGADRIHASAVAVDNRGRTVGTAELGVPLETAHKMGPRAVEQLRKWESMMTKIVEEIAAESSR